MATTTKTETSHVNDIGHSINVELELEKLKTTRRKLLYGTATVETLLLGTFIATMDSGNREHWLLLLGALLVYGTLGMGLIALGAHMNVAVARTLRDLNKGYVGG